MLFNKHKKQNKNTDNYNLPKNYRLPVIYFGELINKINEKSAELVDKGLRPAYVKLPVELKYPLYSMLNKDILRDSLTIKFMGLEVIFSYAVNGIDDIVVIECQNELLSFHKYNGWIPM